MKRTLNAIQEKGMKEISEKIGEYLLSHSSMILIIHLFIHKFIK